LGGESAGMRNRMAWGLAAVLAVVVLGGVGLLGLRLRPYWVAKYRGQRAHLFGATLRGAHLEAANLQGADLRGSDLREADLCRARFGGALMQGVDLRGADLQGADLGGAELEHLAYWSAYIGAGGPDFPREDLRDVNITGAHYDARTLWPDHFDPVKHGAILEK
jgi:uncharacterized protein YjbI with pentapeptide repeats